MCADLRFGLPIEHKKRSSEIAAWAGAGAGSWLGACQFQFLHGWYPLRGFLLFSLLMYLVSQRVSSGWLISVWHLSLLGLHQTYVMAWFWWGTFFLFLIPAPGPSYKGFLVYPCSHNHWKSLRGMYGSRVGKEILVKFFIKRYILPHELVFDDLM